jgi:hypothetical protein
MRRPSALLLTLALGASDGAARAQEPPPAIGPFVLDIRGTVPSFSSEAQLAESRGISPAQLPGRGLGVDAGIHLYVARWKAVTFGVGAQVTLGRARSGAQVISDQQVLAPVTEQFASFAPQLSFNFGTGDGWSYISGGVGQSQWSIVPQGREPLVPDVERLRTFNYGGGARWFMKRHLAFNVDVRFHEIHPRSAEPGLNFPPRTTMLVMGAGISLK